MARRAQGNEEENFSLLLFFLNIFFLIMWDLERRKKILRDRQLSKEWKFFKKYKFLIFNARVDNKI